MDDLIADRVALSVDAGIAQVRLARPDKLNACDDAMFDALGEAGDRIAARHDVRAVVLSGEGRAFCVGIDLAAFGGLDIDLAIRTHGPANRLQHAAWVWRTLPQPVIAAIHGYAFGAGLQVALGADIRIAHPDAELAMMEIRWGLAPDIAGIALMKGLVRTDVARDLCLTGRRVPAAEAQAIGLVTRIADDPQAAALTLAHEIAAASPDATRAAKRLINRALDEDLGCILFAESQEAARLIAGTNHREAVAAGMAKRAPRFTDPEG